MTTIGRLADTIKEMTVTAAGLKNELEEQERIIKEANLERARLRDELDRAQEALQDKLEEAGLVPARDLDAPETRAQVPAQHAFDPGSVNPVFCQHRRCGKPRHHPNHLTPPGFRRPGEEPVPPPQQTPPPSTDYDDTRSRLPDVGDPTLDR